MNCFYLNYDLDNDNVLLINSDFGNKFDCYNVGNINNFVLEWLLLIIQCIMEIYYECPRK